MLLGPSSKSKDYDRSSPVPLPIPKPILFSIVSDSVSSFEAWFNRCSKRLVCNVTKCNPDQSQPQPYYATSTNSLLITSSEYRTQGENLENATKKVRLNVPTLPFVSSYSQIS